MSKLTGREEGGPMGEGMGAVTWGLLAILLVIFIGSLFVCQAAKAADWVATWDPNPESDVVRYFISIDDAERVNVGNVTEYRFSAGDSVCAQLWAQDLAGNLSDPSILVCVKASEIEPPDPPVITPCDTVYVPTPYPVEVVKWDTLEVPMPYPVEVVKWDTLRLWYPVEVPVPYPVEVVKWDTLTIFKHERPLVEVFDGKLFSEVNKDRINIRRDDIIKLKYVDSSEEILHRINVTIDNLKVTDWKTYFVIACVVFGVVLIFVLVGKKTNQ